MPSIKKVPDFKETISFQQYRGSIDFLQAHIHLVDASLSQTLKFLKASPDQNQGINVALGLDIMKYSRLNHPTKQHTILITHAQKKNIEFSILRMFNFFTTYLQNITREMFLKNPLLIVGKAVVNKNGGDKEGLTVSYAEIIRLGNYSEIQEHIIQKIFRSIEELKSTSKLLEKILKDTKVSIPKSILEDALTYLEMRHLFVHNRGLVDLKYEKTFGIKFSPALKHKSSLPTKFDTFNNATSAITKLVGTIDGQLITNGLVEKRAFNSVKTL
jgi:hypothetical protein